MEHRVIKIVHYHDLEKLSEAVTKRGGFVIYLVRDPRGLIPSRSRLHLDKGIEFNTSAYTQKLCRNYERNLKYLEKLNFEGNLYIRSKVIVIRYEDFAYAPTEMTTKLYAFLNRNVSKEVHSYIKNYTNGPTKNSRAIADAWRQRSHFEKVEYIQEKCGKVHEMLGYSLLQSEHDMKQDKVSVVKDVRINVHYLRP